MSKLPSAETRCVLVYGKESSADRERLMKEFSEFGKVKKIFTENTGKYSKVYFENREKCKEVADAFKVNHLGWIVEYPKTGVRNLEISLRNGPPPSESSIISSNLISNKDNTMDFADEVEGEYTQNSDYCTLHGEPVTVLTDDSGDIYVNYKDVKKAGFALFRRDNYDALLMDRKQISKEFELFLLAEARSYILKRSLKFSEEEILSTIERCREKVLSGQSNIQPSTNATRSVNAAGPSLAVTNGKVSGFAESREGFKKPRPPHKNFQLNSSVTNERSDKNDQSFGGGRTDTDRPRDFGGREGSNQDRSQSRGLQKKFNGSPENNNYVGKNVPNDNDAGRNRSNDQEFGRGKPSNKNLRNKLAGGAVRKNAAMDDTSFQNDRNNQDSQNSRGTQPRRQHTNSNASVFGDDCSSVRSDKYAKKHAREEIESVTLQPGNTYDVIVSYVDNEKVQWVQTEEYSEKVIDMTVKLVDAAPLLEDIANPVFGQLVLAQQEDAWFRARVINQEPLLVHYLDYGNKNKPSGVKVLPEEYKKLPATALRTTGLQNLNINVQENQPLRLTIKQQYDDGTYLVKLNDAGNTQKRTQEQTEQTRGGTSGPKSQESYNAAATHSTPQQDLKENIPAKSTERRSASRTEVEDVYAASNLSPLFKLKNDEPVKIIGRRDCQLLVKNKQCYEKCKELNECIKNLDKSGLPLGSVKVGQLVLAKKNEGGDNEIWQRATVLSKENAACIQISYIDFPGEDILALKSLRNVDEHLANYPALMTITPALPALENGFSSALEYIDQLIQEKAKLILVIEGDDVDFKFEDGNLLSKKIYNLSKRSSMDLPKLVPVNKEAVKQQPAETEKPSAVSSSPKTVKSATEPSPTPKPLNEQEAESPERLTFDYMDWTRLTVGTHDVLFYNINDATDMTVVSTDEKLLDQLALVTAMQVNDDMPYEPIEGEMCLVAYKSESEEESSWYRAFITSIDGEKYSATCVDFGNEVVVTKNEIRRFPLNLKDIPMLGIVCECVGIPNNDKVTKKLKELLPEGEQAEIKVIACVEDEMKCKIEIPTVYEAMKQQGVI